MHKTLALSVEVSMFKTSDVGALLPVIGPLAMKLSKFKLAPVLNVLLLVE